MAYATRIVTADAATTSASEFLSALRPQRDPFDLLMEELFTASVAGDRARIADIHLRLKAWKAERFVDLEAKPIGDGRFQVAA